MSIWSGEGRPAEDMGQPEDLFYDQENGLLYRKDEQGWGKGIDLVTTHVPKVLPERRTDYGPIIFWAAAGGLAAVAGVPPTAFWGVSLFFLFVAMGRKPHA